MDITVVNNEIFIYDEGIKKHSWCALRFMDMVNGVYGIKEKDGKFYLIAKRYRKVKKYWEITDDELGIDNNIIIIETTNNKIEMELKNSIQKNTVLSVEVCRNKDGQIFGISWQI